MNILAAGFIRCFSACIAVALISCASLSQSDFIDIECAAHADCEAPLVCYYGLCRDPGKTNQAIYFDLTPPNDSGLLPQMELTPRQLANGAAEKIIMSSPVLLLGAITTQGGEPRLGVISATRILNFSDDTTVNTVLTNSLSATNFFTTRFFATNSAQGYQLALPAGTYHITFSPSDKSIYPPINLGQHLLTTAETTLSITYPENNSLLQVSGQIVASATTLSPIAGASVSGIGETLSNEKNQSTTTITDINGRYTLFFPPGAAAFTVLVEASPDNRFVPTANKLLTITSQAEEIILELFVLETEVPLDLQFNLTNSAGTPILQGSAIFRGDTGAGTFSSTSQIEPRGNVSARLLPGNYQVTFFPDLNSQWEMKTLFFCLHHNMTLCNNPTYPLPPSNVILNRRYQFDGQVTFINGLPAVGATVTMSYQDIPNQSVFSSITDEHGKFSLWIDQGLPQYTVTISPRPPYLGEHLPLAGIQRWIFSAEALKNLHGNALFPLAQAALVHGKVTTFKKNLPVGQTRIAIYQILHEGALNDATVLRIGTGESHPDGDYVIAIPPSPVTSSPPL